MKHAKSAHERAEKYKIKQKLNKEQVAKRGLERIAALRKKNDAAMKKLEKHHVKLMKALKKKVKMADDAEKKKVKTAQGSWNHERRVFTNVSKEVIAAIKQHGITKKEDSRTRKVKAKAVTKWKGDAKNLKTSRSILHSAIKALHDHVSIGKNLGY